MDYEQVLYEVDEGVAVVTLNRPEKLNAMTALMGAEMADAMAEADADDAVRAVVLTGAGRAFCAGADLGSGDGFAAGWVAGRQGAPVRLLAGLSLGVATMYAGGVAQLMGLTGQGLANAVAIGVVPFLVGDLTKIAFAFFTLISVRKVRGTDD